MPETDYDLSVFRDYDWYGVVASLIEPVKLVENLQKLFPDLNEEFYEDRRKEFARQFITLYKRLSTN